MDSVSNTHTKVERMRCKKRENIWKEFIHRAKIEKKERVRE